MSEFYDQLADLYHLIFPDWQASIDRQAAQLSAIIHDRWPAARTLLDVSCGIGTQSIGLATRGFAVTGSDLSPGAVARARLETQRRGLDIPLSICDMRQAHHHHQKQFDVVISADNSITHLLTDADLLLALRQMHACTRPGGGCLLTVRDYDAEQRGAGLVKPYGVREQDGRRYLIFQVWDFVDQVYDMAMYFIIDDGRSDPTTRIMRTRYNAVGTDHLLALMQQAGFTTTHRLDGQFYQPVLLGTREAG